MLPNQQWLNIVGLNAVGLQRINHFHGMLEICRKRSMAKNLAALAAALPAELKYDFFPQTWQLPGQLNAFLAAAKAAGKKQAYIVKPDAGCQVRASEVSSTAVWITKK